MLAGNAGNGNGNGALLLFIKYLRPFPKAFPPFPGMFFQKNG